MVRLYLSAPHPSEPIVLSNLVFTITQTYIFTHGSTDIHFHTLIHRHTSSHTLIHRHTSSHTLIHSHTSSHTLIHRHTMVYGAYAPDRPRATDEHSPSDWVWTVEGTLAVAERLHSRCVCILSRRFQETTYLFLSVSWFINSQLQLVLLHQQG